MCHIYQKNRIPAQTDDLLFAHMMITFHRTRTLVLTHSTSNGVHNYTKHSLWCDFSLRTTNLVHFLIDKVDLQKLRQANYYLSGSAAQRRLWPPRSRGLLITHKYAPQSVGLLWTSDQPLAESSTWQHTTHTPDKHPCPRWDSNPRSQ
jgi:hypothetical protein